MLLATSFRRDLSLPSTAIETIERRNQSGRVRDKYRHLPPPGRLSPRNIVVKFEFFELYYWLKIYEL